MSYMKFIAVMMFGFGLSACANVDTATRNALHEEPALRAVPVSFDVQQIRVSVPKSLKVSEANRYYPMGDIVWREDAPGDRRAQVKAIMESGLARGVAGLQPGRVPVVLDVEVTRFHALSEKARYTIGGMHAVHFNLIYRNPVTGEAYSAPKAVRADFKAFGGQAAIAAERRGITQKVRITERLASVIQAELALPLRPESDQISALSVTE
ncbi:DUF6778 family protein [Roseovarius sp.]|uniref:DUF6778 family protein n=1 Tax=Roseovarius sp. TaxID=1486281 RepID=UPI003A9794FF